MTIEKLNENQKRLIQVGSDLNSKLDDFEDCIKSCTIYEIEEVLQIDENLLTGIARDMLEVYVGKIMRAMRGDLFVPKIKMSAV